MIAPLELRGDEDVEILRSGLRTSLTWALDAVGARISHGTEFASVLARVDRIKRLSAAIGHPLDDSYRMGHLRAYAEREGVSWPT